MNGMSAKIQSAVGLNRNMANSSQFHILQQRDNRAIVAAVYIKRIE